MQAFHSPYNTGPQACEALQETRGSRMALFIMASVILHLLVLLTCAHWTRHPARSTSAGEAVIEIDLMSLPGLRAPTQVPGPAAAAPEETPAAPMEDMKPREPETPAPVQVPAPPAASIETAPPQEAPALVPQSTPAQEKIIPRADAPLAPSPASPHVLSESKAMASEIRNVSYNSDGAVSTAPSLPAGTTTAAPAGAATGSGTGAPPEQYVEENFYYIKDLITRNLSYPVVARRMKWQGTVVVCFVVCEDGSVKDMTVTTSSGHSVLDKNALATIESSQPFPPPPAAAEFNMPIAYTLKK